MRLDGVRFARLRLRQQGLGAHLPGDAQGRSTSSLARAGGRRAGRARARPTRAATSSAISTTGTPGSGRRWAPSSARARRAPAAAPLLEVEFVGAVRDPILRQNDLQLGTVVANRELVDVTAAGRAVQAAHRDRPARGQSPTGPGTTWPCCRSTRPSTVDRALRRFGLSYDTARRAPHRRAAASTFLPTGTPVTAGELLASYVELAQPGDPHADRAARRRHRMPAGQAAPPC